LWLLGEGVFFSDLTSSSPIPPSFSQIARKAGPPFSFVFPFNLLNVARGGLSPCGLSLRLLLTFPTMMYFQNFISLFPRLKHPLQCIPVPILRAPLCATFRPPLCLYSPNLLSFPLRLNNASMYSPSFLSNP